jgi:hypothetical protein
MSTRMPQAAESFDSTAKLMLEALAKASAELEKSVTAFTEQLLSFNEGLQKSLDEELRSVNTRLEGCIKNNLDELGHTKHVMLKRLFEAEQEELIALSYVGKDVRSRLSDHALEVEGRIQHFMQEQIAELKQFLQEPESQINAGAQAAGNTLDRTHKSATSEVKQKDAEVRRRLSDKVMEIERQITEECERVKQSIAIAGDRSQHRLNSQREQIKADIGRMSGESTTEINTRASEGAALLSSCEAQHKEALNEVGARWKEQINEHCDTFNKTLGNLSAVVKENYETKLSNVSAQAKGEINKLSDAAHEKIAATRNELEIELRELEKEYVHQFESTVRKLESIVNEHANDKKNSGVARQHKAQKLRDQMQTHLNRWGGELIDSVKDASHDFEAEYSRATDGFHTRIETARVASVELLERESRLMQKDIERTLKDFQREIEELEGEIGRIEKAGQDAALTVIACRKAVLSFRGE